MSSNSAAFARERGGEAGERRLELLDDRRGRRRRGSRVGMTSFDDCPALTWSLGWTGFFAAAACRRGSRSARLRDHLVGVHVGRGARAGLEDVERELRVVLARHHLARRLGGSPRRAAAARCRSSAFTAAASLLIIASAAQEARREAAGRRPGSSAGALGLRAVVGAGRHLDLAQAVLLHAGVGHRAALLATESMARAAPHADPESSSSTGATAVPGRHRRRAPRAGRRGDARRRNQLRRVVERRRALRRLHQLRH